jgi:NCS2 family nucleobase:cation symporter-2
MYENGFCPTADDGTPLPCPDGYGALIATSAVTALVEILLSFIPPKMLRKIFPPIVTGPTVMLIGLSLVQSGFDDWIGGSGSCMSRPTSGMYTLCPEVGAPHALPWGSAEFIGLGFVVFLTIVLCERFGSPIMKSCSVVLGLLVGCIIAAACGYSDPSGITEVSELIIHLQRSFFFNELILTFNHG